MGRFLFRRLLEAIPVVIGVSILAFSIIHLIPGDPAVAMLGERASEENIEAMREALGLNKPLYEQYAIWMGNIAQGDFGTTARGNVPISSELTTRFPATIELSLTALVIAVVLGLPIGIISAIKRNTLLDTFSMFWALFGVSIPIFVLGLLLIFLVGVELGWLPFVGRLGSNHSIEYTTGFYTIDAVVSGNWEALWEAVKRLILPSITLSTVPMAIIARITRSSMLEVLNQDYIRTAYAKGLQPFNVNMTHAPAKCPAAHRDHHRAATRQSVERSRANGDDFLVAGGRQMAVRLHHRARLSDCAGHDALAGNDLHCCQSVGRCLVRCY